MFEIPDDDDEFWEKLPLGVNFMDCKQHDSKSTSSINNTIGNTNGNEKKKCSGNSKEYTGQNVLPNAFPIKNNGPMQHCSPGSKEIAVFGHRPDRISLSKPTDLFNLTQSSSESDLDLSLNSDCDSRKTNCVYSTDERNTENKMAIFPRTCGSNSATDFMQNNKAVNLNQSNFKINTRTNMHQNYAVFKPENSGGWTNDIRKPGHSNSVSPQNTMKYQSSCSESEHSRDSTTPIKRPNVDSCVSSTPRSEYSHVRQSTPNRRTQEVRVEKESPFCSNSKAKRKFPGPAGLLPKLVSGQSLDTNQVLVLNSPLPQKKEPVIAMSQCTVDVFNEAPWQMLLTDLGEECHSIIHRFSIQNTVSKVLQKQLPNGKVPLLFGVLERLDIHGVDGSVVIRDKTGRMQGTVHRELLREGECQLQQGVVIVLKQVAVISPSQRTHYLNITPSNVISVYRSNGDGTATVSLNESDHLLSQVQTIETQLREAAVPQTPKLGQLLSQPGTPIHRVTPNPALFQTVQQSARGRFDPQASPVYSTFKQPQSKPGTPQYQGKTHALESRIPQCPQRTTQFQARTPQFQARTPQFQARTPQIQARTPQIQGRTPQIQGRTPQFQGENTQDFRTVALELRGPDAGERGQYHQTVQWREGSSVSNIVTSPQWEDSELPIPPAVNIYGQHTTSPLQSSNGNILKEFNSPDLNLTPKTTRSKWTFKSRNSPNVSASSPHVSGDLLDPSSPVPKGHMKNCISNKRPSGQSTCNSRSDTLSNNDYLQKQIVSNIKGDSNNNQPRPVQNNSKFYTHNPNKVPRLNPATSIQGGDLNNRCNRRNSAGSENGFKPSSNIEMEVDNLWQDDLTDEFLTELTDDFS